MQRKLFIPTLCVLCLFVFGVTSCSSKNNTIPTTNAAKDRTTGYKSPDGVFVGPRGKSTATGVPVGIGAYGKRKNHKGDLIVTKDGTNINGVNVSGVIYVNANSVTITNFTATRVTQKPGKKGMDLEDGTINGKSQNDDGIQWGDFTLRRMNIFGSFDGIKAQGNVTIQDSYIHDLHEITGSNAGAGGYSHNDCVQVSVGHDILIENNWMDNCGFNSAIFIDPDQGKINNVTVQHNYLNGGGITLYAIASRSAEHGLPTNVTITENVFGDTHIYDYATAGAGITFTNNVRTNGAPITPRFDNDTT